SNSRTATSSSLSSEVSLFGGIESVLLREMTGLLYYRSIDGTEIFGAPPGLRARSRPSWAPTENGVTPPHGIAAGTAATAPFADRHRGGSAPGTRAGSADADVDLLDLGEAFEHAFQRRLTTEAGGLHAAVGLAGQLSAALVDLHPAGLDAV